MYPQGVGSGAWQVQLKWNGRLAMVGFIALLVELIITDSCTLVEFCPLSND